MPDPAHILDEELQNRGIFSVGRKDVARIAAKMSSGIEGWPTDEDVDRALAALNEARLGTRGPIPRQAMRKALLAGLRPPDTRTEDEKDYDLDRYSPR